MVTGLGSLVRRLVTDGWRSFVRSLVSFPPPHITDLRTRSPCLVWLRGLAAVSVPSVELARWTYTRDGSGQLRGLIE